MTACYPGPSDQLVGLVKDILGGKEVNVPTMEPTANEDQGKRNQEVDDVLTGKRAGKK